MIVEPRNFVRRIMRGVAWICIVVCVAQLLAGFVLPAIFFAIGQGAGYFNQFTILASVIQYSLRIALGVLLIIAAWAVLADRRWARPAMLCWAGSSVATQAFYLASNFVRLSPGLVRSYGTRGLFEFELADGFITSCRWPALIILLFASKTLFDFSMNRQEAAFEVLPLNDPPREF